MAQSSASWRPVESGSGISLWGAVLLRWHDVLGLDRIPAEALLDLANGSRGIAFFCSEQRCGLSSRNSHAVLPESSTGQCRTREGLSMVVKMTFPGFPLNRKDPGGR